MAALSDSAWSPAAASAATAPAASTMLCCCCLLAVVGAASSWSNAGCGATPEALDCCQGLFRDEAVPCRARTQRHASFEATQTAQHLI